VTIRHGDTGPNLHAQVLMLLWNREQLRWESGGLFASKEDAADHCVTHDYPAVLFCNVHQLGQFLSLGVSIIVDQTMIRPKTTVRPFRPTSPRNGGKKG
jgi:hypothetical protein